jgi:hypothetical protein
VKLYFGEGRQGKRKLKREWEKGGRESKRKKERKKRNK